MNRKIPPRLLLALLTTLNLLNYVDRFILASLLETIKAEFSLSDLQAGSLATAFILGYFLTSPIFGYLGDRMQRKWLISLGIFVWSLATVLTGFANSFGLLLVYRVLVGVGEASYATLSPALISDAFPAHKRNNALTIFYVAIPLGAAIGTLFGSWAGTHYGWHQAFLWAGAPGLLFAFCLLPFREPSRGESEDTPQTTATLAAPTARDILRLFSIREFKLAIWGYVAYTFALGAYQYWGQAFLQRVHQVSQENAGQFFGGVMVVTGIVGTFLGGFLATRLRRRSERGYAILLGTAVLLSVPVTLLFTFASSLLTVQIALGVTMLLLFLPTGPINTVILESVPINLRASAMAISIFCIHAFGDLWSPLLVGKISDYFGSLHLGLAILPPALFICGIFWSLLRGERTGVVKEDSAVSGRST